MTLNSAYSVPCTVLRSLQMWSLTPYNNPMKVHTTTVKSSNFFFLVDSMSCVEPSVGSRSEIKT